MPEEQRKKGKITVEEAGRKGGERTSETHGREFYEDIGRKGGSRGGHQTQAEVKKYEEMKKSGRSEESLDEEE